MALLATVCPISTVVAGDAASEADALSSQATALRKQDHDREALPLFERALSLQPTARAAAQLGLCEQALGLWREAEEHIGQALTKTQDPWVVKNGAALREALAHAQERLGSVDVWGTPDGAQISIDARAVGTLPLPKPLRAPVGSAVIVVSAPGFETQRRKINVAARVLSREHVALVPADVAAVPNVPSVPGAPERPGPVPALVVNDGATGAPSAGRSPPDAEGDSDPVYKRWWFWTAIGTVAVAGVVSAVLISRGGDDCRTPMGGACPKW